MTELVRLELCKRIQGCKDEQPRGFGDVTNRIESIAHKPVRRFVGKESSDQADDAVYLRILAAQSLTEVDVKNIEVQAKWQRWKQSDCKLAQSSGVASLSSEYAGPETSCTAVAA